MKKFVYCNDNCYINLEYVVKITIEPMEFFDKIYQGIIFELTNGKKIWYDSFPTKETAAEKVKELVNG